MLGFRACAKINPVNCAAIAAGRCGRRAALAGRIISISIRALIGSHLQGRCSASTVTNLEVIRPEFLARDRVTGHSQSSVTMYLVDTTHIRILGFVGRASRDGHNRIRNFLDAILIVYHRNGRGLASSWSGLTEGSVLWLSRFSRRGFNWLRSWWRW